MATERLYIGQTIRGTIRTYNAVDLPHVLANPTAITITVKAKRSGTISTYEYPGTIVKTATGTFYFNHPIVEAYEHEVTGVATGAYPSAAQPSFYVQPRNT